MIHELKNILYQIDDNKNLIIKMEPYVEKSKELASHKGTLEGLETGKTASIWLIPIEYAEAEKYGFIRKYITHRRRYREYVNSVKARDRNIQRMKIEEQEVIDKLTKEISEAKEKLGLKQDVVSYFNYLEANVKEAESKKTPRDMGLNLYQVAEIFEKNGVPFVLTEEDKVPIKNTKVFNSIDDFVCVHQSNLAPVDDEIKTECCKFTLNGVEKISDNEKDCKYVVYIKAPELLKQGNISSISICDTKKQGNVNVSKGAVMICPKDEVDEQNTKNPSLFVIGYDGNNASGFDQSFVGLLGYSPMDINSCSDTNIIESEVNNIIKQSGIVCDNN